MKILRMLFSNVASIATYALLYDVGYRGKAVIIALIIGAIAYFIAETVE